MILIRPIESHDFEAYAKLASEAHVNFFTLPKDRRLLEARFERALHSFQSGITTPGREFYLFVAEEIESRKVVGVSAISATTGGNEPLYFFRKEEIIVESHIDAVKKRIPILNPVSYVRGPSELASLFVTPEARGLGAGKLLSLARFLFVARHPERFTGTIIAELRGHLEKSNSRFWDGVGRHFFDMSFEDVQELMRYGRSFIDHFMPKYPIYVDLLPEDVRQLIGKVDVETMGAFKMLEKLGFEVSDEIDILDGGPKLKVFKENVRAVRESQVAYVAQICQTVAGTPTHLVSNERLDFRACLAAIIHPDPLKVTISRDTASALEIGVGDPIRLFDVMPHLQGEP